MIVCAIVLSMTMSIPAWAGQWFSDGYGWKWMNDNGTISVNTWQWIDGNFDGIAECYCFNPWGYCLLNTITPDGHMVNASGAWTVNGVVQILPTFPAQNQVVNNAAAPVVSMETLNPYASGEFGLGHEFSKEDTLGNTYAFAFHGYMDIEDGGAYEIFNIQSKYKYLNATVAVAKPWHHVGEKCIGHIKIYGDDRLIWSDDNIKGTTKPYDIQVNIEGVEDLKIEMYGDGNLYNYGIHVLLCNPTLSE